MKPFTEKTTASFARSAKTNEVDIESIVGWLLLGGVVLSMLLLIAGLAWHWVVTGRLTFEYTITGMNLYQFLFKDVRDIATMPARPRLLLNLGIAVLLLTPYARVLVSMCYFAFVERNWKYTCFTGFVLGVLTYSLFLR